MKYRLSSLIVLLSLVGSLTGTISVRAQAPKPPEPPLAPRVDPDEFPEATKSPEDQRSATGMSVDLGWNTFLGGSAYESGSGMDVDADGNVYVIGDSGPVGDKQVFVAKLDPSGALTWQTFLGGSGNDFGYNTTLDGDGNIYVVGHSESTWGDPEREHTDSYDAFAAKLDSSGALTWNTFLGGSSDDAGYDIAVDDDGNVYVTGSSEESWGSPVTTHAGVQDGFAAKLDADGVLTWNTFLGGSGYDEGHGITVASDGSSYIAGYSEYAWSCSPMPCTERPFSSESDAFAAKLNTSGALVWNSFLGASGFDYGYAIVLDGSGNVYVQGNSSAGWGCSAPTDCTVRDYTGGEDAFTAKLDSFGALVWNTFLGGSGHDRGNDIRVGAAGTLYVTGYSSSSWGSPARTFNSLEDGFAAKLDSSGALTWNTFLGGNGDDFGLGLALDGGGNLYVVGNSNTDWGCTPTPCTTRGYSTDMDAYAAKLSTTDGVLTWNSFIGGNGHDMGYAIAVDAARNVYVVGQSDDSWGQPVRSHSAESDGFVTKLDSSGALLWHTFLGGEAYDDCRDIAVDDNGNIYVSGVSYASWGSPKQAYSVGADSYAAKLDPSGVLLWNTFLGGSGFDWSPGIAVDASYNVYVIGDSSAGWGTPLEGPAGSNDVFVAKLDSLGTLDWHTFLGGIDGDYSRAIALDGSGNPYVTGYSKASWGTPERDYTSGRDAFVASLDTSGGVTWNTFLGGSGDEYGVGLDLDPSGHVLVGGYSGVSPNQDLFAAQLEPDGGLNWSANFGGTGNDAGGNITADGYGNFYLTGSSTVTWGTPVMPYVGSIDAIVVKVGPTGNLVWNAFLGGTGEDEGWNITMDHLGTVYVTGNSNATWGSPERAYSACTGLYPCMDAFVAAIPALIISGNAGVAGATLSYTSGTPKTATADEAGDYAFGVPDGWSGAVMPCKAGYFFTPSDRTYTNVTADQLLQDYDATRRVKSDFDADGISDMGYFHPATGLWGVLESKVAFSYASPQYFTWGQTGDIIVPGDYDGDGLLDPAIRRPPASGQSAAYLILKSSTGYDYGQSVVVPAGWPGLGDTPVPGDYNGDGSSDPAIWRGNTGVWIIPLSPTFNTYQFYSWGTTGDTPVGADVDGDGRTDIGYWRPSTGVWGFLLSSHAYSYGSSLFFNWGTTGDIATMEDYDGDGLADPAVVIPPAGGQSRAYRILLSTLAYDTAQSVTIPAGWPGLGDTPVPADYDGDAKADAGIWRANTGVWIIPKSSTNNMSYMFASWGASGDVPAR